MKKSKVSKPPKLKKIYNSTLYGMFPHSRKLLTGHQLTLLCMDAERIGDHIVVSMATELMMLRQTVEEISGQLRSVRKFTCATDRLYPENMR